MYPLAYIYSLTQHEHLPLLFSFLIFNLVRYLLPTLHLDLDELNEQHYDVCHLLMYYVNGFHGLFSISTIALQLHYFIQIVFVHFLD